MKILNPLFIILQMSSFIIGFVLWVIIFPILYIRYKTTKDSGKKIMRHPNIAMIFIYKVIDNLFKNYIIK